MIKILQHVKSFRTGFGGVERVVEELVPELNGYQDLYVDVLCQGVSKKKYELEGKGQVVQTKPDLAISSASLSWQDYRYWRHVAASYDVIHVHAPWPQSAFNLLCSHFNGAVVVHWHSDVVRQRALYHAYRPLERWLLRRADRICVTSPKLLEQSVALEGVRHKAVAIPIGIREPEHHITSAETHALRVSYGERFIVFALGRLVPYKGFEYLVRAAPSMAPEGLILIAGDGPLRYTLERLIQEMQVEDRIKLLGRISNRDVELYMQACDAFCLPSVEKSEAFGIVQIEAMRAARPVVSTRILGSGIDWVNQHGVTGYTVDPREPGELAAALNNLVASRETTSDFGNNARLRYEQLFTAPRTAQQVREMYLSLCS